jgi:chromosome segregation ATPase
MHRHMMTTGSNPPSPRTPTLNDAERLNRALGLRIINLHEQYGLLQSQFDKTDKMQVELKKELTGTKERVMHVESRSEELEREVKSLRARLKQAEEEAANLRTELQASSNGQNSGTSNGQNSGTSNGLDRRTTRRR